MTDMFTTTWKFKWLILAFIILIAAHASIRLPGAEDALPADVTKAIAKCDGDVEAVQAKAEIEKFKVRKALIATLVKAQDKVVKAGNLDAANAIKAKIAEIEKLTAPSDLLATAPAAAEGAHTSKFVMLYPLPDFKGTPVIVKTLNTITDFTAVGFPNDALRSIKIPAGLTVTLFESENGSGRSNTLSEDTAQVGNVGGSGASSFIVNK